MRHGISGRKFNRTTEQRMALLHGLAKSLIKHEQIKTTLPKAKDLRPFVEKMITLGKDGSLANRRRLFSKLRDNDSVRKVFSILAERYKERNGGYLRIVKCGFRVGDTAPAAYIEFIDRDIDAKYVDVEAFEKKMSEKSDNKISKKSEKRVLGEKKDAVV